nr:trypsin-like serine protease [Rhodoplanes serenus]
MRLVARMRRLLAAALSAVQIVPAGLATVAAALASWPGPAAALVGDSPAAAPALARHVVLIVGSRGSSCTGTVLAPTLVLTAAHCVQPGADYKLVSFDAARRPTLLDVAAVLRHPGFDMAALLGHRATADVALLHATAPLPAPFVAAPLGRTDAIAVGDPVTVVGLGVAVRGDGRSGGTARMATLAATGRPGSLQLRLVDPAAGGERPGRGACTGDSGAPAFRDENGRAAVAGVVSWSTGPKLAAGCGGLTGVTPLVRYRAWIVDSAQRLGVALSP